MKFRYAYVACLLICSLNIWSQCVTQRLDTPLVSDRFRDAVQYGDFLVFANEHGLVYFDRNDPGGLPVHIEALSGNVSQVRAFEDTLTVIAEDTGVYILKFAAPDRPATITSFYAIPQVKTAVRSNNHIFAGTDDQVVMYRLSSVRTQVLNTLTIIDQIPLDVTQVEADGRRVYMLRGDGSISVAAYKADGFIEPVRGLEVEGEKQFFGMFPHSESLVVETADGVAKLRFDIDGRLQQSQFYYRREGARILYDVAIGRDYLYLRFEDLLEVHLLDDAAGTARRTDSLSLPFGDIGITRMATHDDHLFLINVASQGRNWSAETFVAERGLLSSIGSVSERFEDLSGATALGSSLYLSAENTLYLVKDLTSIQFTKNLPVVATFDGTIQAVTASDNYLMVVANIPRSPFTRVYIYNRGDDELNQVYTKDFRGTIQQISQYGDAFAFVTFQRTTNVDQYTANVISDNRFGFQNHTLVREVDHLAASPFLDHHLNQYGLVFHNKEQVEIHPNLASLGVFETLTLMDLGTVKKLIVADGRFWAESDRGLLLLEQQVDRLVEDSRYPHWYDLTLLGNHLVLARNQYDRIPSRYHMLSLREGDFLASVMNFTTATPPAFISSYKDELVVAEKTALNLYGLDCPQQDVTYLLPFAPDLELELSTPLADGNLATLTIYDANNQVIGLQPLTSDIIDNFNGRKLAAWLYDFDRNQQPFTCVLSSSQHLAPVISGFANADSPDSRFAFEMEAWTGEALYLPHIPKNRVVWNTNIFLRNQDESNDPKVRFRSARGRETLHKLSPGDTEIINVDDVFKDDLTPWASVQSDTFNTAINGFGLFLNDNIQQAAAVGLVRDLSDYLIVPFLAGREDPSAWTGLVLANPNRWPITVRTIGYNPAGELTHDDTIEIPASDSLVVVAEDWLREPLANDRIEWIALASDLPLMGMVLYGNGATAQLSGMALKSFASQELVLPGVRQGNGWWTRMVLTNIDPLPADVELVAMNGFGDQVATAALPMKAKENLEFVLADLFPDLNDAELATIQSVRARSNYNLAGMVFRGVVGTQSLEAFNAENR